MIRYLPVVWLVACYSPSYEECKITCAAGTCPSGFLCDHGLCRGEDSETPCVDPNGDSDTDGVKNSMDNCPAIPNVDQANEDKDSYGDLCDPCPIDADPAADADSDTDGVGDGCDPWPDHASRIVYFENFNAAPTTSPRYVPASTSWLFQSGKASVNNPGANTVASMTWPLPMGSTGELVIAAFANNQPQTSPPTGAGVTTIYDASSGNGIVCWVARDTTGDGLELYKRGTPGSQMLSSFTFVAGAPTRTSMTRTMEMYRCADAQNHSVMATYTAAPVTAPHVGLFVIAAGVTFEYVLIVTR